MVNPVFLRVIIEVYGNGILVQNGDRNALANAALAILKDPKKWWFSSTEVAKKYSWDRTAELWENLISEVVKR